MTLKNLKLAQEIKAVNFRLRDETFAFDIAGIRKITGMMDITVIHEPAGFIRGVVNLKGQVIVVVDLAGLLGLLPVEEVPPTARIIFIEFRKRVFGFIVDQVFDVVEASQVLDMEKVFLKLT
jgi:purine-binding chemotaxis protein CheW